MSKLNVEETLRALGLSENVIPDYVSRINKDAGLEKAQKEFIELKELLMEAFTEADLNGTYPVKQIKQLSKKLETLVSVQLETQEEVLANIVYMQEQKKKPATKFLLEMNKHIQYKTYGLKNGFYVISADSQIGKTGWMIQLAVDALVSNDRSNIIFISLDDSKAEIINRFICALAYRIIPKKMTEDGKKLNTQNIPEINCVPSGYSCWDDVQNCFIVDPVTEAIKKKATEVFLEYHLKRRITVVDGINNMASIEDCVYRNKGEKTLLVVDAAYNIDEHYKNDLEKDAKVSLFFKLLPVRYGITVIAIKELSKKMKAKGSQIDEAGERKKDPADIGDTKGSVIWEYNSTAMATLYEYKGKVCVNFQKNKASGRRFTRYYEQEYLKNAYRELDLVVKYGEKK